MGNHVAEVMEGWPSARTIKVHAQMCSELLKVVVRVSKVFPEIEAARPRCSSGLEALCLLNNGIAKAKSLLQHCSESSVLYLALTGDAILSRCKKSRNLLEQSLSQIQNMVPVMLAAKISGIIADLRSAVFWLDPSEEEAGKVLRELLHRYGSTLDSTEEAALAAVHTVSALLHISSQKALLIEKRSIRKLLEKFGESEPSEVELRANYRSNAQIDMLSRPVPPLEFICPLSSRLMYDPVVIASGQTYERMWIQKWFDEGHDTCPKTNRKLNHLLFTSNTGIKDLIMKWCSTHGVSIPDPEIQQTLVKSWETSMNSIASLSSSMNDLYLPLDLSNTSLGSSQGSDLYKNIGDNEEPSRQIDMEEFSRLPWDSQCIAVEDVKKLLKHNDKSWSVIPSEKFIPLILGFLKDAHDLHDVEAQMTGCLLLFEFVHKNRNSISYMKEDAYDLLASFLDTEISKQALAILEELSFDQHCGRRIAASGAFIGILNILDSRIQELLEPALKILCNLSSNGDVDAFIIPSMFIPKLVPLFEDNTLSTYCITILKNLCENEDGRMSVAETDGCIASISKLLEKDSHEDQEHTVSVLLSLCSQRVEYCHLVMDEGVIPGLVSLSINGNKKAKAMAMELLRILKEELNARGESSQAVVSTDSTKQQKDKNPPKAPGLFGRFFSKPSALAARKKK
ncbi:UNVERIFIED_CONTAM: U-box domain-containing protein 5 [Sesamum calycinum]|uniref:RING-type E3 ubiquitin transferase n=1 Tax=Sesamum calycinum TaxID=2727403 RepID=A0AAW2SV17_9LAMI